MTLSCSVKYYCTRGHNTHTHTCTQHTTRTQDPPHTKKRAQCHAHMYCDVQDPTRQCRAGRSAQTRAHPRELVLRAFLTGRARVRGPAVRTMSSLRLPPWLRPWLTIIVGFGREARRPIRAPTQNPGTAWHLCTAHGLQQPQWFDFDWARDSARIDTCTMVPAGKHSCRTI